MFKCIPRYARFTKPLGQIHLFRRHYAKEVDLSLPEGFEDISRRKQSELIKTLKRLNEQHEPTSDNCWLDVFYRDNSADQTKRVNEIKKAFHRYSQDLYLKLDNNPAITIFKELDKLEDYYYERILDTKDEELISAVTDRYKENLKQLNIYGYVEFNEIVDSSQFSLFNARFIAILNSIQLDKNGEVISQASKISELVNCYMMLPVPRLMILDSDQISKFVGVVTDGFTVPVCFQASGAILKDIQESKLCRFA
ncbi:unnamed protein product [Ambrosiozyma monospora]|uniref:Unnamed protein product n=1 Tax=Ambrosiozyma monospora TaxID=43982 RepID=A0ACB5T0Y8_AMBMO|nr:unnamed protein product [Ambrosiozyma monospora]